MISLAVILLFCGCARAENVTLFYGSSGIILNYNYTEMFRERDCVSCQNLSADIVQGYKEIYDFYKTALQSKLQIQLLNVSSKGVYFSPPSQASGSNFSEITSETTTFITPEMENLKILLTTFPVYGLLNPLIRNLRGVFYIIVLQFEFDVERPEVHMRDLRSLMPLMFWRYLRLDVRPPMSLLGKLLLNETGLVFEEIPEENVRSILHTLKLKFGFPSTFVHQPFIPEEHRDVLSVISYVGCVLSLIGLLLTIVTIVFSRKLHRIRANQILLHICVALLGALLIFVFGTRQLKDQSMVDACKGISALLHYFLLSAMTWTSIEAYNLYKDLVKVFETSLLTQNEFMCRAGITGWVLPAIVVVITVISGPNLYGFHVLDGNNQTLCWMQRDAFYGAFLGPILLLVIGNTVIFFIVMREIFKMPQVQEKRSHLAQSRASISVFVLLGLNWAFAGLAATTPNLVVQYLFTITCSFQGFMIFILHGILKKDFQDAWKLVFTKKRTMEKTRSGTSTSQKTNSSSISQNSVVPSGTQKQSKTENCDRGERGSGIEVRTTSATV